ncbi:hypothetical protein P7K49_007875 [Saguinus oedipus]|uniref:Uncharacterized protein n=1 Tax=Saguinus oedipus TaxID=9490 RepID=A0ABQ9VW34_SAGOE|nr:hypothetical protein P7K49_007875 [Saguinus oedipus]
MRDVRNEGAVYALAAAGRAAICAPHWPQPGHVTSMASPARPRARFSRHGKPWAGAGDISGSEDLAALSRGDSPEIMPKYCPEENLLRKQKIEEVYFSPQRLQSGAVTQTD